MENQEEKIEDNNQPISLDYSITDFKKRNEIVHEIVKKTPSQRLTPYYLEKLANYLVETKEATKEKQILTSNIMVTVNKRETSFEGLMQKFQSGEDGVYNLISQNDKNVLLVPKIGITKDDRETIPGLEELIQEIEKIKVAQSEARGRKKYLLTKQLKEMRQQQYQLKMAYKPPVMFNNLTKNPSRQIKVFEKIQINEKGDPVEKGTFSFFDPFHISCLLCNYSKLKEDSWGRFQDDWWFLMQDFDNLSERALKSSHPDLYKIMIYKIDGMQNKDIAQKIKEQFGTTYAAEYLSSLWRKKIPKLIAEKAKEEWIIWHYTFEEKGKWKRCSRCHEIKLAHPYFFTKNKSSKDGWYSMCKCCRNKKTTLGKK